MEKKEKGEIGKKNHPDDKKGDNCLREVFQPMYHTTYDHFKFSTTQRIKSGPTLLFHLKCGMCNLVLIL